MRDAHCLFASACAGDGSGHWRRASADRGALQEQQGSVFEQIGRAIALVSFPSPKIRASDMPWLLSLHGRIFYRMMVSDADSTVQVGRG